MLGCVSFSLGTKATQHPSKMGGCEELSPISRLLMLGYAYSFFNVLKHCDIAAYVQILDSVASWRNTQTV
jgi:hypothetical protein